MGRSTIKIGQCYCGNPKEESVSQRRVGQEDGDVR